MDVRILRPMFWTPGFLGHSVGHWEGDTLVIDTVGFNEKFWMTRFGLPHTDALHLVERISRPDYNTLKYEATIDDPKAYTRPWSGGHYHQLASRVRIFRSISVRTITGTRSIWWVNNHRTQSDTAQGAAFKRSFGAALCGFVALCLGVY